MHDLPRKLTADELAGLFGGRTALVQRLAQIEDPLDRAPEIARSLSEAERAEALAAHPRIGEASPEQRGEEPDVLEQLAELNRAYEERFGFRFVVFVDRRSRRELLPILQRRLRRTRGEELATGLDELVAIARNRWLRR